MNQSENALQAKCFQWCNNTYLGKCYIFSVPNGGTRDPREAQTLKSTGTRAGVADLILLLPEGKTVFIEMKTESGKQSDVQRSFELVVNGFGFQYYICRTFEEFKDLITKLIV